VDGRKAVVVQLVIGFTVNKSLTYKNLCYETPTKVLEFDGFVVFIGGVW
jgi:hypothetical protein